MEHPSFFYSLFPYFFECVNYWWGCVFFIGSWFWDRNAQHHWCWKGLKLFVIFMGCVIGWRCVSLCRFVLPSLINEYESLNIGGDELKLKSHNFTGFLHWLSMYEFIGFIPL